MGRLSDRRAWQQLRPYHGGGGGALPTVQSYWVAESAHMTLDTSSGFSTVQDWDSSDDGATLEELTVSDQFRFTSVGGKNHAASTSDDEIEGALAANVDTSDFTLFVRGTLKGISGNRYLAGMHGGTLANQYLFVEILGITGGEVEARIGDGSSNYAQISGTPTADVDDEQVWCVGQKNGTAYFYVSTELIGTDTNGYSSTATTLHLGAR